jgi:cytoskeletal protein RodZ
MTTGSEDNEKRVWPGRVTLIIFLVVLLLLGITALILAAAIRRKRE